MFGVGSRSSKGSEELTPLEKAEKTYFESKGMAVSLAIYGTAWLAVAVLLTHFGAVGAISGIAAYAIPAGFMIGCMVYAIKARKSDRPELLHLRQEAFNKEKINEDLGAGRSRDLGSDSEVPLNYKDRSDYLFDGHSPDADYFN